MLPCACFDIGVIERVKFYVAKQQKKKQKPSDRSMFDWLDSLKRKGNETDTKMPTSDETRQITPEDEKLDQSVPLTLTTTDSKANGSAHHETDSNPNLEKPLKSADTPDSEDGLFVDSLAEEAPPGSPGNVFKNIGDDVEDVFENVFKTFSSLEDEASEFAKRCSNYVCKLPSSLLVDQHEQVRYQIVFSLFIIRR